MASSAIAFPFFNKGLAAMVESKQLPPGAFPSIRNAISEKEGGITARRGRSRLGQMPAAAPRAHTIDKLCAFAGEVPGTPSLNPRYVGAGSDIYRSTTLADGSFTKINPSAVCTAPASDALSRLWTMAAYAAGVTAQPWAFFAGEKLVLKDSALHPCAEGAARKWGITPAFGSATAMLSGTSGGAPTGSTVGAAVFHGTGLNDASSGGLYTGAADGVYTVEIVAPDESVAPEWDNSANYATSDQVIVRGLAHGTALYTSTNENNRGNYPPTNSNDWTFEGYLPDRYRWNLNGGAWSATSAVLYSPPMALSNGVTITFGVTYDHTAGDYWTIAVTGIGGSGSSSAGLLDGGAPESPVGSINYNYRYVYRSRETGHCGNPSAPMADDSQVGDARADGSVAGNRIAVHLQAVEVKGWGTDDPQVNEIVIYREGGILLDGIYRKVGWVDNPGLGKQFTYTDVESDVAIQYRAQLEDDNDPPVNSTLQEQRVSTSLAAIVPGRQLLQTVDPIFTGVLPGTIVRPNDTEACVIEEVLSATEVVIWAQFNHPVGSPCYVSSIVGQPCTLTTAAFDSLFLAGDPNNPQTLYKSKTGRPESFPIIDAAGIAHTINVGTPANGIVAITEFRGNILCMNTQNFFEVAVFNSVMSGPNVTPANRGLAAPKAWCVADNEIWYLAFDGIWSWGGSESTQRSKMIEPLFRGLSVPDPLGSGVVFQPIDMDPKALQFARIEYRRGEIHFLYLDKAGSPREIVYDILGDRWLPMDKGAAYCAYRERDTNNLLLAREDAAGAVIALDDYLTADGLAQDEGEEIAFQFSTGWIDGGDQCVAKVFDEILLDIDPQGLDTDTILTVYAFYDYSPTPVDAFVIKGVFANSGVAAPARRWLSLQTNLQNDVAMAALSSYGRQAQVVAFQFLLTTSSGLRPTLYGMRAKIRPVGEITGGAVYDWSDLGHKYDKRLYEFTVEFDAGTPAHILILDTIGGILGATETDAVQSFEITNPTILGPGRAQCTFPIKDGVVCKMVRLRAVSSAQNATSATWDFFRILKVDFQKEDYPADIVPFCEPQDDGYPFLKYLNQFTIDVDTNDQPIEVQIQADGTTLQTVTIQTTAQDRDRTPTIKPNLMGRKWRWYVDTAQAAIASGLGKFQVFSHAFRFQPADKGEVGHTFDWDDLGHPFDKRLQTVTIEWDNEGEADVTMQLDIRNGIDGGTLVPNTQQFVITGGRHKRTWGINDTNNIAKLIRLYPLDDSVNFRQWKYDFKFIPYPADTVYFTDVKDFGWPFEKIARVLCLTIDTGGVDCRVDLIGDGAILDTFTINTALDDYRRFVAVKKDVIAKLYKLALTPGGGGKSQLWDWDLECVNEPPYISYWRSYEQALTYPGWKFQKQIWLEYYALSGLVMTIESDTGSYTKELPAHTTRSTERFLLPVVFGDGLNKSKVNIYTIGSLGFTAASGPSVQWGIPGDFITGRTMTLNAMIRVPHYFSELRWNISEDIGLLPVGCDAVFDVMLSSDHGLTWTSILAAPKLVVPAAGPSFGTITDFAIPSAGQGDWMKVVCLTAGSVVPGRGLRAMLFGDVISPASGPLFKVYPDGSGIQWIACGADRHAAYQKTQLSHFWKFPV